MRNSFTCDFKSKTNAAACAFVSFLLKKVNLPVTGVVILLVNLTLNFTGITVLGSILMLFSSIVKSL